MKYILIAFATVLLIGLAFADDIHDAAAKGDLRSVRSELDKGVNANAKNSASAAPPLLLAALNSQTEVTKLLMLREQTWIEKISLGTPLCIMHLNMEAKVLLSF